MDEIQFQALIDAIRNLTQVHAEAMADLTHTLERELATMSGHLVGDPDAVPIAIGQGFDRLEERLEKSLGYISGAVNSLR